MVWLPHILEENVKIKSVIVEADDKVSLQEKVKRKVANCNKDGWRLEREEEMPCSGIEHFSQELEEVDKMFDFWENEKKGPFVRLLHFVKEVR